MTTSSEPDGVLVDIEVGGAIVQVLIPAEVWAKVTREVEENGITVEAVIERALVDYTSSTDNETTWLLK